MSPDLAASTKARLLAHAKRQREEFERTLARSAAERLLYRLGASRLQGRCILKGASLLAGWLTNACGPTPEPAVPGRPRRAAVDDRATLVQRKRAQVRGARHAAGLPAARAAVQSACAE